MIKAKKPAFMKVLKQFTRVIKLSFHVYPEYFRASTEKRSFILRKLST